MFCWSCGAQLLAYNAVYCSKCGTAVRPGGGASPPDEPELIKVGEVASPFGRTLLLSLCLQGDHGYVNVTLQPAAGEEAELSNFVTDLQGLAKLRRVITETEQAVQRAYASRRITRFGW